MDTELHAMLAGVADAPEGCCTLEQSLLYSRADAASLAAAVMPASEGAFKGSKVIHT